MSTPVLISKHRYTENITPNYFQPSYIKYIWNVNELLCLNSVLIPKISHYEYASIPKTETNLKSKTPLSLHFCHLSDCGFIYLPFTLQLMITVPMPKATKLWDLMAQYTACQRPLVNHAYRSEPYNTFWVHSPVITMNQSFIIQKTENENQCTNVRTLWSLPALW